MEWITPRTDWKMEHRMDAIDYNRIKNNLQALSDLVNEVYGPLTIEDMGADKSYESWFFAREFNLFERNLETINRAAYSDDIGEKKMFFDNGPFIDYEELNRIENAMLSFFVKGTEQKKLLPRLALRLGGAKGVKV